MTALVFQYCFAASIQTTFYANRFIHLNSIGKTDIELVWQVLLICGDV
jgi:hypothetical protein